MSASPVSFDAFLRGEQTLAELERALAGVAAADPQAAASLAAELDELYRAGRLPLQVHVLLRQATGHAPAAVPGVSPSVEATRLRPLPEERTVARRSTPVEQTVRVGAAAVVSPPEATRRNASVHASRAATGSDWSHPEQWTDTADAKIAPGSVIKQRFELESILGQGGMGVVFRAKDLRKEEAQDRDPFVAIKILSDEFRRHPHALIALQREARKAQTLAHPNVITVHDFDRDGSTVYMTMELLDGEPLNKTIAGSIRGLARDKALPAIRGMAAALAYAHQKGIVHSDFKPGNVFLTRRGEVKVLDFGIARAVPTGLQPNADKTVFDAAELGALTPPYASPEMLRGESPVPADDVFALGLVAYELLTGRHPFDKTPAEDARRQGLKPPAVPTLPRRQRKALARALAFDRSARHVDAGAFLQDFDGVSPLRKAAYTGLLVVLAGAAAYGWYASNQLVPDIPWEALSDAERSAFDGSMEQGYAALAQADTVGAFALNDAFTYFDSAFSIHRNNPAAVDGLRSVADRFLAAMQGAPAADQQAVLSKLYCQPYLASYRPVASACRETLGAQCTATVLRCPVAAP